MNKVALITGGTRGIGKEIAYTLAEENYDIIINYRTENEELMKLKKEIEQKRSISFPLFLPIKPNDGSIFYISFPKLPINFLLQFLIRAFRFIRHHQVEHQIFLFLAADDAEAVHRHRRVNFMDNLLCHLPHFIPFRIIHQNGIIMNHQMDIQLPQSPAF